MEVLIAVIVIVVPIIWAVGGRAYRGAYFAAALVTGFLGFAMIEMTGVRVPPLRRGEEVTAERMNLLRGQEFFDDYGYPAALVFFGAAFGSLVGGVAYRSRRPPVLTPIPPAAIVDIPEDGSGRP